MEKKKILIFSLAYHPYIGGAEQAVAEITDRIPPEDIEFHMVTLRYDSDLPREERVGNVNVRRIGMARSNPTAGDLKRFPLHLNKFLYQGLAPLTALRTHKKEQFDGVWAIMAHSAGVPAALFHSWAKVPFALTLQEGDPVEHIKQKARPVWPLFKRAFTKARVVQAISSYLADFANGMGYEGNVEVIGNGVDIETFSKTPDEERRQELRKQLGAGKSDTLLITTSRLVHKNGIDTVIRALPEMPKRVHFAVLGTGPLEGALKALARQEGVEERVNFLGHVAYEALPEYLHAADIFVRPSRSEGLGSSFIEAMAAGLPIIATKEGGIKDFLFDSERDPENEPTGFAVDVEMPLQIAAAVERIEKHPEETKEVADNALALARSRYEWDAIAEAMQERVFSQL